MGVTDWIRISQQGSSSPGASPPAGPSVAEARVAGPSATAPSASGDQVSLSGEEESPRSWIFMRSTYSDQPPAPKPTGPIGGAGWGSGSITRHSTSGDGRGSYDSSTSRTGWGPDGQVHQSGSRTTVSRLGGRWGSDTYRVREEWKDGQYRRSGSRTSTSTFSSPWGSETYRSQSTW